ncbi:MAG TPA: universal stress protein [Gemmatimonadales bacterium]|nr:universal stress protein [Gemmatimonadales bacterium]
MKPQSIVVGVDGSPESASAASAGWMLARAAEARCRLVHAANDVSTALEFAGTGVWTETMQLARLSHARAEVSAGLRGFLPPEGVHAMIVSIGRPVDVLEAVVAETEASLLMLGGKHHSRLGRWLGGSSVQQVVRRLHVPLLVTAGKLPRHPRVLVAVDASYAAAPTARQAVALARRIGCPLRALHVIDPPPAIAELPRDWSRDFIERDVWPLIPVVEQARVIREGPPFETIVAEASAWQADIVVVGSHGKGWVDRLLIGSVTEKLLNDLPAAVLVVPVPAPVRAQAALARAQITAVPA